MSMDIKARKRIRQEALFLEEIGYEKMEDEYSIKYYLKNLSVEIAFPPNSDESDVLIRFKNINQIFSVGWIALVRKNITGDKEKTENVVELLKYIKDNYLDLTDYEFCLQSNILIDKYVEENRSRFEKAIVNFLEKA